MTMHVLNVCVENMVATERNYNVNEADLSFSLKGTGYEKREGQTNYGLYSK